MQAHDEKRAPDPTDAPSDPPPAPPEAPAGAPAPGAGNAAAEARTRLFARLAALGIETTTTAHPPVFTVEESRALRGRIPGGHCKCLFLKDKRGALWLVVADEARRVDLKGLARALDAGRLSFGSAELLRETLGVEPGSVTPFALINDTARRVRVVLDRAMLENQRLNYHPLSNDATTTIGADDLKAFIAALGHQTYISDLDRP